MAELNNTKAILIALKGDKGDKGDQGVSGDAISDGFTNKYLTTIDYADFTVIKGQFDFRNGSFTIYPEVTNRMCIDLSSLDLKVGDSFSLPSYDVYDYAVGTNILEDYPWINGGYLGEDLVLTADNLQYAKGVLFKRLDNAEIQQSDIDYIQANFKIKNTSVKFKDNVIEENNFKNARNNMFIHMSFDDVTYCLQNLKNNKTTFTSIFDDVFLAKLKELHEKYSAKFSLYVYQNAFNQLDDTYLNDFNANSDWLKIGFHATNETANLVNETYDNANSNYVSFLSKCLEVAGTIKIIDMMPRLHYFGGSEAALNGMRDTKGFIGCLTADDDRDTIYLTEEEQEYLRNYDNLVDNKNNLAFYSTDMRLDWFNGSFSSDYNYDEPVKDNPYDELVYRMNTTAKTNMYQSIIVFTHEWQCYNSSYELIDTFIDYVEQVCKFANDNKIPFDYPMYHVSGLVNQFSSANYKVKKEILIDFVNGSTNSDGTPSENANRVRSEKPIYITKGAILKIEIPSGYECKVTQYKSPEMTTGSKIGEIDFSTSTITITGDGKTYVVPVLAKVDDTNIDSSVAEQYKFIMY